MFLTGTLLGIIPAALFLFFYNARKPDNKVKLGIPERITIGLICAIILSVLLSSNSLGRSSKNIGMDKPGRYDDVNSAGPAIVSKLPGLSPQELKQLQDLSKKLDEIARKYLTPNEYTQFNSISRKMSQGIATADEISRGNFLWNKLSSRSSSSEKETLDEMNRLGQELAGAQK